MLLYLIHKCVKKCSCFSKDRFQSHSKPLLNMINYNKNYLSLKTYCLACVTMFLRESLHESTVSNSTNAKTNNQASGSHCKNFIFKKTMRKVEKRKRQITQYYIISARKLIKHAVQLNIAKYIYAKNIVYNSTTGYFHSSTVIKKIKLFISYLTLIARLFFSKHLPLNKLIVSLCKR